MNDIISTMEVDLSESVGIQQAEVIVRTQTLKSIIRERNKFKPRSNFSRISKFLHIVIFEMLTVKEIFRMCMVSRSFKKSSCDPGTWERYFPDKKRLKRLQDENKGNIPVKELLMRELNVITNMTVKRRFQTYNLVGHSKMITSLDMKRGLIVSGSHDNAVKVWDI